MATIVYQFAEKMTEGITDLTLFKEKIDFDAEEPNLIVEEDSTVLEDTSPAVNYKEVMLDFEVRRFLSKPSWLCPYQRHHTGLEDTIHG